MLSMSAIFFPHPLSAFIPNAPQIIQLQGDNTHTVISDANCWLYSLSKGDLVPTREFKLPSKVEPPCVPCCKFHLILSRFPPLVLPEPSLCGFSPLDPYVSYLTRWSLGLERRLSDHLAKLLFKMQRPRSKLKSWDFTIFTPRDRCLTQP